MQPEEYQPPKLLVQRFMAEHGTSEEETHTLFDETKRFLLQGGTPAPQVDKMWHQFILFTTEYHEFCALAGRDYIHHVPTGSTCLNVATCENPSRVAA